MRAPQASLILPDTIFQFEFMAGVILQMNRKVCLYLQMFYVVSVIYVIYETLKEV